MTFTPKTLMRLSLLTYVLFLSYSCNKDSDLLAEYVIEENPISDDPTEVVIDLENALIATNEDVAVSFNLLNNTSSTRKGRRRYKSNTEPKHGKFTIEKDSIAVYTPTGDFNGEDEVEITLEVINEDETITEEVVDLELTVAPVEDVVQDTIIITQEEPVIIEPLENDTFNEESEVIITEVSQPANGTAEINEDNTITYTPNTTTSEETNTEEDPSAAEDSFTYTTSVTNPDNTVSEETGSISVTVTDKAPTEETIDMGILKAFPTAYGAGSDVTGGRGGKVLHVTNLNASGDGSLKAALETSGPAYIVFDVSGVINLPTNGIVISKAEDKTVLGQTAPQGGITLTGGKFRFNHSRNLIIRYIRSRPRLDKTGSLTSSDDAHTSAFLFYGTDGVILDHVSASFAHDKGINFYNNDGNAPNTKRITVQNSLIADSNTMMNLGNNPQADMTNCQDFSVIYNLFGNSRHRTPNMEALGYGEIINNVVHGWGSRLSNVYNGVILNHIGNYYKNPGLGEVDNKHQQVGVSAVPLIYTSNNFYSNRLSGSDNEDNRVIWSYFQNKTQLNSSFFVSSMHPRTIPNPSPILSAQEAYDKIIADVGANKYLDAQGEPQFYIDDYDKSVINNVKNNIRVTPLNTSNWRLPELPNNNRLSSFDTDNDGMADAWENRVFGDLSKEATGNDASDSYTNIEVYAYQVDF
ncbi:hypothetical protein EHW67_07610 [Arenibacter aquaticus]|uniref:RapA2 cadherin-like domain-containing protein n=1 Tax=Arenibacter aquaticus TaxID=2489054 RepID=A0A3S0IN24_9FLAO|nr:Ig-like domain-containing protein [Arenibacter aquaticus]RTE53794.1 hypothetical protein EHW67_07610 [Arenibacter aquaticus]